MYDTPFYSNHHQENIKIEVHHHDIRLYISQLHDFQKNKQDPRRPGNSTK